MRFRPLDLFIAAAILGGLLGIALILKGVPETEITGAGEAIDGDSVRLTGIEIRLKGIDAPELFQKCQRLGQDWPCGQEARAALRRKLSKGLVTCIGAERDRYGRLLAVCRMRGADLNAEMVREGLAVAFGGYQAEEKAARDDNRGLWAGKFERPGDYRAKHPRQTQ